MLNIVSVLPDVNATDVILGAAIIVTFDEEIDTTTLSETSFLLSAPPEASRIEPDGKIGTIPQVSGTDYVQGAFSFALNQAGQTVATFKPARPLRANVKYSVLITTDVQSLNGEALGNTYSYQFTTGVLNLTIPPPQMPLPSQVGRIKPSDVCVSPSSTLNNDLHNIQIKLPSDIDTSSFDPNDIQIDLEAFLQDMDVKVPTIRSKEVTVSGDTISITLAF